MRTKAQVLEARAADLRAQLEDLESHIEGLKKTPTSGIVCAGCGEALPTEYDFAAHFLIPDERYLNLGSCPVEKV